jgi:uncharacterized glyoxalase superfamily protein PhnB
MQSIYPVLKYDDGYAAMEFLERAFGFERVQVNEGESGGILHAEMRFGDQVVMFGTSGEGDPVFNQGIGRTVLYVVVDDPDALHARAKEAGADVVMPLTDQEYGSRDFAVRDPEGNIWSFGTYRPEPSS